MSRRMVTFSRIIKAGLVNFGRNAWLAIAAMAVMVITLTIILFSLIANATFANTIQQITDKIDVSVFLRDETTPVQRDALMAGLKAQSTSVRGVEYLSKEEALKRYKEQNANNPQLLAAISETDNPLPATIRVKPTTLNQIAGIKTYLDKKEFRTSIAEVSYSGDRKEAIDRITHATNLLRKAGVVAVSVFAIISVLIIFNTIQMAIFNRRDELTIMRLLGASTSFIRGPFVVESIIYGVLSALISVGLIHALFVASSSALQASSLGLLDIGYASTYFKSHVLVLLTMQVGVGILIGAVSSIIATHRYLKFKTSK
jgi:cell division transport system permease protein